MSKFVITTPPEELKPCPLCGGAAQAYDSVYEHHIDSHVVCKNPECACALHNMESPQRAREAWNSRFSVVNVDVDGFNINDAKAAKNELELAFLKDGRSWRITALNREMALQAYISICLVLDVVDADAKEAHDMEARARKVAALQAQIAEIQGATTLDHTESKTSEKQTFWSMALWVAHKRGYQKGWASHLYRDKFGVWPRKLNDTKTPPDEEFESYVQSRVSSPRGD